MANTRKLHRSFAGGEISPEMHGRDDDAKYQSGAARLRNMASKATGVAVKRPGTRFVIETKDSTKDSRLLEFTYSITQTMVIEMGDRYFRFHTEDSTLLSGTPDDYITSKAVTAISGGANDYIEFASAHGFSTDDPIRFTGAPLPLITTTPQVVEDTTYYAKAVPGQPTRLQIMLTTTALGGTAIDITALGAGTTVVSRYYSIGEMVSWTGAGANDPGVYYCLVAAEGNVPSETAFWHRQRPKLTKSQSFLPAAVDIPTNVVTLGRAHGLSPADPVEFMNYDGELPGGITAGTTYYVRTAPTTTTLTFAATEGGAEINLTNLGSTNTGVHRIRYAHSGDYIYEIPHPYIESNLFSVKDAQSLDVMTLTHDDHLVRELRRYGATDWRLATVTFGGQVEAPTSVNAAITAGSVGSGVGVSITNVSIANPCVITTTTNHDFAVGETLHISGIVGNVNTVIADGFYIANVAATNTFTPKSVTNGTTFDTTGKVYTSGGRVQPVSLSAQLSNSYKVTAVGENGEESVASDVASVTNNILSSGGAGNTITWAASTGASRYNVYKLQTGLYGYIGQTEALTFEDDNIAPDMGLSPPITDTDLNTYPPNCVCYFEQRRCFAAPDIESQSVWMTQTGTESGMNYSLPIKDDDRIKFQVAALESFTIRHLVPLDRLVLLTSACEFRVMPVNSDVLTPTSVDAKVQSYVGSSDVQPEVVNNTIVFCANRGGHVHEMGFRADFDSYVTNDLSVRAAHLFDDYTIADMALSKSQAILWFVSSSGDLLGLTYMPQESIAAWHWHDTDGSFESVAVVAEGIEDRAYFIVNRTIDDVTVRYVESLSSWQLTDLEDGVYADCSLTYSGAAATNITGLDHLEGETVAILAAGVVVAEQEVTNGAITLTTAATPVQIGLPYTAQLRTLPFSQEIDGAAGAGRTKNANKAWVRVYESGQFQMGPTEAPTENAIRPAVAGLTTGELGHINLAPSWSDGGQVYIESSDPVPLTVVSLCLEVSIGS